jgi:hypothetical protein
MTTVDPNVLNRQLQRIQRTIARHGGTLSATTSIIALAPAMQTSIDATSTTPNALSMIADRKPEEYTAGEIMMYGTNSTT